MPNRSRQRFGQSELASLALLAGVALPIAACSTTSSSPPSTPSAPVAPATIPPSAFSGYSPAGPGWTRHTTPLRVKVNLPTSASNVFNSTVGVPFCFLQRAQSCTICCSSPNLFGSSSGNYTVHATVLATQQVFNAAAVDVVKEIGASFGVSAGFPIGFWASVEASLATNKHSSSSGSQSSTYEWWETYIQSTNSPWWKLQIFQGCQGQLVSVGAFGYVVTHANTVASSDVSQMVLAEINSQIKARALFINGGVSARLSNSVAQSAQQVVATQYLVDEFNITHTQSMVIPSRPPALPSIP